MKEDTQETQVQLVHLARPPTLVPQVHKDSQVRKVYKDLLVLPAQLAILVLQAQQVHKDHWVQEPQVLQVLQDLQAQQATPVQQVQQETGVPQVIQALQAQQATLVPLVPKGPWDWWAQPDPEGWEQLAPLVLQALEESLVKLVPPALLAQRQVPPALRVQDLPAPLVPQVK